MLRMPDLHALNGMISGNRQGLIVMLPEQAVPSLIFWEVRRKDFWEQMAHHIATIGLITYSYQVK